MWQYNYTNSSEFYHHGILGMKWGVRRFQKKNGTLTNAGKKRYNENDGNQQKTSEKRGLTSNQKKAIAIGAAVAVTALATYGAYKLGAFDKFTKNGKGVVKSLLDSFDGADKQTGFKLKKESVSDTLESIANDVKAINPGRNRNNCIGCSVAYDLRRRGLDVVTKDAGQHGFGIKNLSKWYKGVERDYILSDTKNIADAYEKVSSKILNHGEGARGILDGQYLKKFDPDGSGHAIAWEVLNGKVEYMEGQGGYIYSNPLEQIFNRFQKDTIAFARLDNLEVNNDYIKNIIKDNE